MKCIVDLFGDDRSRFQSSCRFDILFSVMLGQSFTDFIFATSTDGSGKAASYVRALDMLGPPLTRYCPKPIVGGSLWHGFTLADIHAFSRLGTCSSSCLRRRPHWRFAGLFMCILHWVNYDKIYKVDCDRV